MSDVDQQKEKSYKAQCHCGQVKFSFLGPKEISHGLRCNCSLCARKGVLMSPFTLDEKDITEYVDETILSCYQFGENIAKHYFCKRCGVYPFHAMRTQPGKVRINLACVEGIDSLDLAVEVFDGAGLIN